MGIRKIKEKGFLLAGRILSLIIPLFFLLFFFSSSLWADIPADITYFSSLGSRVPGHPGNTQAANYILNRFQSLGLSDIKEERYPVTVPEEGSASLTYRGEKIILYPLWPNYVRTNTIPPSGISGPLVYGGNGALVNYRGVPFKGAVVLLDFNCQYRWTEAGLLGAQAVIFVEPDDTTFFEARRKFLNVPLDLPRFYIKKAAGAALIKEVQRAGDSYPMVTIQCRQNWHNAEAVNILGYLNGSDPTLKKEIVCLTAYYDSMSVVPGVAPGADQASGIAVLLNLAEYFSHNPPKRTILFLAVGSHFEALQGMTDFVNRHYRKKSSAFRSTAVAKVPEPLNIKMMFGLELSSHSSLLATYHNGYELESEDLYVQRYFAPLARKMPSYLPPHLQKRLYNGVIPEKGMTFSAFVPEKIQTDGSAAVFAGLPALSFVTIYDNRRYFDTPLDTVERVNLNNLAEQAFLLRSLFSAGLNDPDFFPRHGMELKGLCTTLQAHIVYFDPKASFVPNQPVVGAVVCPRWSLSQNKKSAFGVRGDPVALTDTKGEATFPQIPYASLLVWEEILLEAYLLDPQTGRIVMAPDQGINGAENYPPLFIPDVPTKKWTIVLFPCVPANLYDLVDPRYLIQLDKVDVFDATGSIPTAYGFTFRENNTWAWSSESEPHAVIYAQPGTVVKVAGEAGPLGKRILLLNAPSAANKLESEGLGYPLTGEPDALGITPYQACQDMINLNDYRIQRFSRFGVSNQRLTQLHQDAKKWFSTAGEALENGDWAAFLTNSRRALSLESRAYPDVRATSEDVVKGLIFYFILLLPFAFFSERLFFGFPDIRKQIAAVFGIFLVIYFILRLVHPGFYLSTNPEIILLGFIILAMSALVIFLISGRFEGLMQRIKRERSKTYETDIGRITATATAFGLGIANMKRRKLRTTLTAITLILLTFTVLSFTSVKSYLRYNQLARPYPAAYEGFLIRDPAWFPLEDSAYDVIEREFNAKGFVAGRAWYINPRLENKTFARVGYGAEEVYASGLLGLTPEEKEVTALNRFLVAGSWFENTTEPAVIISERMAKTLGFSPALVGEGYVDIFGESLLVRGIFAETGLATFKDLDNEAITPADFAVLPTQEMERVKTEHAAKVFAEKSTIQTFIHQDPGGVVLVPFGFLRQRGGTIQSVAVKFLPGINLKEEIEDFVSRLAVTLFAGINGKTSVYSSLNLTSFSGMGNLFIPILIASLIVLNTMLGSVYERIREIGIYSSVGLAPNHIAALFFAEACVYAVLGVVAGYLLGQAVARILLVTNSLSGLTLNYSSLSAVLSSAIVMVVVFLSTIFPARKASQLSVPDVTRRWVLPPPTGDRWLFEFPFTVSQGEVLGLMTFLYHYFVSYSAEAIGNLYTSDQKLAAVDTPDGKVYSVFCHAYLAPYDLGVSQRVTLQAQPAGEFGFYAIHVQLEREGGSNNDWQRLNRRFLDIMRKQFLVWRTLSPKVKQEYSQQGEEELKAQKEAKP